ncbi:fatty acyl-AMP ligase [Kitasatospora sp. NPDC048540]|uniref:fatty acyl-AMP ligase n=1 Tax=unclassified Kitasatospora TaxID=2633591 RepID=UPI00068BE6E7|nr:fatty acyl-AMP ligase [Kitasatospora sp. MBT63]
MTDLIQSTARHAREIPDHEAVVFVSGYGEDAVTRTLTYGQLAQDAQSVAAELRLHCEPGDRVLLLFPTGLEFVKGFLGCLYAGLVPVPVPLPGRGSGQRRRTTGVLQDCGATAVLTDTATHPEVADWLEQEEQSHVRTVVTEAAPPVAPDRYAWPAPAPEQLAFLQYTSGSTSDPKGVMVGHGNLDHNFGELRALLDVGPGSTVCSWLPLFHDMGLIAALLLPLDSGLRTVLMPPTDFVRRPYAWLELIHTYRATHSYAPNFGYNLAARTVTDELLSRLDLSAWRCAANGAEPVHAQTMDLFAKRLAPTGFRADAMRPAYGLAEATLGVTATPVGHEPRVALVDAADLERNRFRPRPDGAPLVSCGAPAGLEVRIVDPATRQVLADGEVGEIWLRGGSLAPGYWEKPEVNAEVFDVATADGDRGHLRTGDLGVLHEGELYVTGRIKDLLIVNGRNLYPHDIERESTGLHPAFGGLTASVFSVPGGSSGEDLVVVQEVRQARLAGTGLDTLAGEVKLALSRSLGVPVGNVVLLKPGKVQRTTSGKVQRSRMRQLFVAGELDPLHEDLAPRTRDRYRPAAVTEDGADA